ncbi:MAG: SH3 domain-containing protein [Oscillospiraceae bacterium]|nr:SH3 domain-containing protein [Oscillospiraceae bacterium]
MKKLRKLLIITVITLAISLALAISASADPIVEGAATVLVPILNVRSGPDTTYSVRTRLNENDVVAVLDRSNGEWYYISAQGLTGYVSAQFINTLPMTEDFAARGRITGSIVNIRSGPSTSSDIVGRRHENAIINIVGISDGWFRVRHAGQMGYVRSDFIEITYIGEVPEGDSALGQEIVDFALGYLGWRYVFGGASPAAGFDCSGFVQYIFRSFDIGITRTATTQFNNDGIPVLRDELQPGDLVFFSNNGGRSISHVGLYIGNCEMIHASNARVGVVITSLNSPQRINGWQGGRRIV